MKFAKTRDELQQLSAAELVDLVLQLQQDATHADAHMALLPNAEDHASVGGEQAYQKTLDEQIRRTAFLTQIAIELNNTLDAATIIERVLRVTATTLGMTNASIILLNSSGTVELAISVQDDILRPIAPELARAVIDHGMGGWVMRSNQSVVSSDVSRDKRWIPLAALQENGSAIVIPLRQMHDIIGILTVFHKDTNHFTRHDLLLIEGVGAQVSVALNATQRRTQQHWRRDQAFTLLSTSQYLTTERSVEELAGMLQEKSISVFGVDYGLLFLVNDENVLEHIAVPDHVPDRASAALLEQASETARRAWQQGSIIEQGKDEHNDLAMVALPLVHNGHTIGAIALAHSQRATVGFSAVTWSLLTVFTSFIASACANMYLVRQMSSYTETLEGLIAQRTRQLQHSRDTLRIVFDNVPEGLLLLDPQEYLLAANNAFCHGLVGRAPRMVVGQGYATIWEELELRGDIRVDTRPSLSLTPNDSNTRVKRVVCANSSGQQRSYEVSRDSIFDESGQVVQYLERWHDVTEHEDMLRRLLFQEQLHSVGRLVASVVEEVRDPLHHAMERLEQFATDTTLQVEVQQQGRQAHQEVGLVLRICESVRHLYQATESDWRCIQVNNLLHRLQEFVTPLFYYHKVELHMELDNHLELVYVQPDAIYQVLLSLLINAQEAMPQGGTVLVRSQALAAEDCCVITIRDEGIGMSEEELTHAFKPFFARMMQGVVPDLYFSQQVIEKHGGRVEIQSKQHVGTTVHVFLPFHDECRKKSEKRQKTL